MNAKQVIAAFVPFWGLPAKAKDATQRYDKWDLFLDVEKVLFLGLGVINLILVLPASIGKVFLTVNNLK